MKLEKIIRPFTNPLFVYDLNLDLDKMITGLNEVKKKHGKGVTKSNIGGWQSDDIKFEECTQPLVQSIMQTSLDLEKETGFNNYLLQYMWVNYNYTNNFNQPHTHAGSHISGVFWINIPEKSGDLVFQDPRISNQMNIGGYMHEKNQFNATTFWMKAKPNRLVLFPSYLSHFVKPNISDKTRVSISFNLISKVVDKSQIRNV